MSTLTTYGPGGFDPTKPDDNVVSVVSFANDHGSLDQVGVLATLLAVVGVLSVEDAANAVFLLPEHLIAEAQAWAVAAAVE